MIDLGNRVLEVVHTPGHSPGGIALWEAASGTLFSGDIVYDGPLIEDTYHANAADYVRSMTRLLELPVRTVHGGALPELRTGSASRDRPCLAGRALNRLGTATACPEHNPGTSHPLRTA